jgi:hypothetical protein
MREHDGGPEGFHHSVGDSDIPVRPGRPHVGPWGGLWSGGGLGWEGQGLHPRLPQVQLLVPYHLHR